MSNAIKEGDIRSFLDDMILDGIVERLEEKKVMYYLGFKILPTTNKPSPASVLASILNPFAGISHLDNKERYNIDNLYRIKDSPYMIGTNREKTKWIWIELIKSFPENKGGIYPIDTPAHIFDYLSGDVLDDFIFNLNIIL